MRQRDYRYRDGTPVGPRIRPWWRIAYDRNTPGTGLVKALVQLWWLAVLVMFVVAAVKAL